MSTHLTIPSLPQSIITQEDLQSATSILSTLNQHLDALTAEKEKVTKPLNEALRQERARFKPAEDKLTQAITHIKSLMSDYLRKEQEAKQAALASLKAGTADLATAVALAGNDTTSAVSSTGNGKVSFITVRKFALVDITKVPPEYLLLNETKVREAMKQQIELPGITYYDDKQIRNTR